MQDTFTEQRYIDEMDRSQYLLEYRQNQELLQNPDSQEEKEKIWRIPAGVDISSKGRRLVGMDPNISDLTLKELIKCDAKLISSEIMNQMLTSDPEDIIKEEFFHGKDIGIAHLSQCILEDLAQTKADLICRYCDDRRLPFVVGAFYINTFLKLNKLSYYIYNASTGYRRVEWRPRRVSVQPKSVVPLNQRELKKYYYAGKRKPGNIPNCPECGSQARLLRVGFRGKQVHVCCTDESGKCRWYMGTEPADTEAAALKKWRETCAMILRNTKKEADGLRT